MDWGAGRLALLCLLLSVWAPAVRGKIAADQHWGGGSYLPAQCVDQALLHCEIFSKSSQSDNCKLKALCP